MSVGRPSHEKKEDIPSSAVEEKVVERREGGREKRLKFTALAASDFPFTLHLLSQLLSLALLTSQGLWEVPQTKCWKRQPWPLSSGYSRLMDIELRTQHQVCNDFGRKGKEPAQVKGSLLGKIKFFPELEM